MLQSDQFSGRSVWAAEAMHRIANLQQLATSLEGLLERGRIDARNRLAAKQRASALARAYKSLDLAAGADPAPCSQELGDIVRGLVEIFGHTVGSVALSLELAPLRLTGEKRRALLLAGSELVVNALRHAFTDRRAGIIQIRLAHDPARELAMLSVADNGVGPGNLVQGNGSGRRIVRDLADVLEGEASWQLSPNLGGTEVVVSFPVPADAIE